MNMFLQAGRFAAYCAHPFAAWRVASARTRSALVISYGIGAYVVTFVGLWLRAS